MRAAEVQAQRQRVLIPFADLRVEVVAREDDVAPPPAGGVDTQPGDGQQRVGLCDHAPVPFPAPEALLAERVARAGSRSEEHTSELQSRLHLVCRLLLEKKKKKHKQLHTHTASVYR